MVPQRSNRPIDPKLPPGTVFVCAVLLPWALGCSEQSRHGDSDAPPTEFRLLTSSMAPTYWGTRFSARCLHCDHGSKIPAEAFEEGWPVRCQRCGGNCSLDDTPLAGSSARIQPASRPLDRFDIVGINQSDGPPLLKRVWGLPGEQLEIGRGELWIDGKLLQKSLPELRAVAIPLDAQWSRAPVPSGDSESSRESFQWSCSHPAPVHANETPPADWLEPAPISDASPIPLLSGLPPLASPDILLRFDLHTRSAEIVIDYSYYGTRYRIALGDKAVTEDGRELLSKQCGATQTIEVAFCDHRLLLSGDKRTVAPVPLGSPDLTSASPDQGATISITAAKDAIRSISLYRDIILRTAQREPGERQQFPRLSADEYFVLGDNQPYSQDSRGPLAATCLKETLGVATPTEPPLGP